METQQHKKIALITGGSRGIGQSISIKLAEAGFFTIIQYAEREESARQTLEQIQSLGGEGALVKVNFKNANAVSDLYKQVDQILQSLSATKFDVLVNNAGIGWIQEFEEMKSTEFDELFAINVKAPFFVTQYALERIQDGGRIINLTSVVTRMAMPAVPASLRRHPPIIPTPLPRPLPPNTKEPFSFPFVSSTESKSPRRSQRPKSNPEKTKQK